MELLQGHQPTASHCPNNWVKPRVCFCAISIFSWQWWRETLCL